MEPGFSQTLTVENNATNLFNLIHSRIKGELDSHYHADRSSEPKCEFTVYVQKEEFLNPILEVFSEINDISVMVFNGENINQYLYRLPLFAAFWIDEQTSFNKVIKAIVNRSISNELVRRIDTITGGINLENPGIMITVEDIQFSKGILDF
jgi:PTS system nitrogen regulatory IIA component